jgi:hypothetical protein
LRAPNESVLEKLCSKRRTSQYVDLSLPEVTALAAQSQLFVGNDSGIAHIAAASDTPVVVIFGSSNIAHWRPWNSAPPKSSLKRCRASLSWLFLREVCSARMYPARAGDAGHGRDRSSVVVNVSIN